jgi:hypothetical protein
MYNSNLIHDKSLMRILLWMEIDIHFIIKNYLIGLLFNSKLNFLWIVRRFFIEKTKGKSKAICSFQDNGLDSFDIHSSMNEKLIILNLFISWKSFVIYSSSKYRKNFILFYFKFHFHSIFLFKLFPFYYRFKIYFEVISIWKINGKITDKY